MPAPFEMVSGPLEIFTAPEATVAPAIHLPPTAPWTLLGTNGARSMSDDGVNVSFEETVESQRSLGSTAVQKQFRTEEDMMLSFSLLDVSAETFALAMSGLDITEIPAAGSTTPADFTATPVAVVNGGSGTGATIASMTVDASGDITAVNWASGGSGYVVGDAIIFTQGLVSSSYTLVLANVTAGVLQNLTGVTIAGFTGSTAGYRHVPMLRGFNVLNLAFIARGFSPYADNMSAQWWVPKGYASFSGELAYTKGEAAMMEIEVMAIEHFDPDPAQPSYGYGQYETQFAFAP